jgi:Mlc titration factor MtfA (ptsG expression regulator)
VLSAGLQRLRERVARGEPGLIDAYGASDPAEFFAVISEIFFGRSPEFAAAHPALHRELAGCGAIRAQANRRRGKSVLKLQLQSLSKTGVPS